MEPIKEAFAKLVQESVRKALETDMADALRDLTDEEMDFEFQPVAPLLCRVRITQGRHKGPRYLDVVVKEHY